MSTKVNISALNSTQERKYWIVTRWNPQPIDPADLRSPQIGYEPLVELGQFQSGIRAAREARKYADANGYDLDAYAISFIE